MIKYIIGGTALGIILGNLTIGLGAAFAFIFGQETNERDRACIQILET